MLFVGATVIWGRKICVSLLGNEYYYSYISHPVCMPASTFKLLDAFNVILFCMAIIKLQSLLCSFLIMLNF